MTTEKLFELFKKNNTRNRNGVDVNSEFISTYGNVSLEVAFDDYLKEINVFLSFRKKINEFENYLISKDIKCTNSNISESRYYSFNGCKYRFSNHVYPTGSMTDLSMNVYDFCANPELIKDIKF